MAIVCDDVLLFIHDEIHVLLIFLCRIYEFGTHIYFSLTGFGAMAEVQTIVRHIVEALNLTWLSVPFTVKSN